MKIIQLRKYAGFVMVPAVVGDQATLIHHTIRFMEETIMLIIVMNITTIIMIINILVHHNVLHVTAQDMLG